MEEDLKSIEGEKWRTNAKFDDYLKSFQELSNEDKTTQNKKRTHFFRYVKESLHNHFKQWTNDLFFLSLFSPHETVSIAANVIFGKRINTTRMYYCQFHDKHINLNAFQTFLNEKCSNTVIMTTRSLPGVTQNHLSIQLIANGANPWTSSNSTLTDLKNLYLFQYSALPTNTQFIERGVKESGYVTLGRRGEKNRSILAIARGKLLPDAMCAGRAELENLKYLQGKRKTKVLTKESIQHYKRMKTVQSIQNNNDIYEQERKAIDSSLTNLNTQFKKERVDKKINRIKQKYSNTPAPNVYERRTGQTLTPLIQGKIQYHKMKKDQNMIAVRNELLARNVMFDDETKWIALLKLLKENEGDKKYFKPLTNYDAFKWNSTHFESL